MSIALTAVLIIGGLICAAAVVIGTPLVIGMMTYDVVASRKNEVVVQKDPVTRIAIERGIARLFVIAGGAFWSIASFSSLYSFRDAGMGDALLISFIPVVTCAATLIIGWYYERFAALLLLAGTIAVVAWGVIYQFEMGVWILMTLSLLGPALTASVLFWLARRDQEAFERVHVVRPELAFAFAAKSTLD